MSLNHQPHHYDSPGKRRATKLSCFMGKARNTVNESNPCRPPNQSEDHFIEAGNVEGLSPDHADKPPSAWILMPFWSITCYFGNHWQSLPLPTSSTVLANEKEHGIQGVHSRGSCQS